MSETYTILYDFVDEEDLTDLEGICEENDGITFRKRKIIINSLHSHHS